MVWKFKIPIFLSQLIGTKAVPETTYKHIEIKEEIIEIDYNQTNIQQTSFPVQARLSADFLVLNYCVVDV